MNLEIKHLAPYIPYGLKLFVPKIYDDFICELVLSNTTTSFKNGMSISSALEHEAKPILRPLYDLEKLLETEFNKLDELGKIKYTSDLIDLFCYENTFVDDYSICDFMKLPYECVEYCFKNHYDVFGLIKEGRAIDINTLPVK